MSIQPVNESNSNNTQIEKNEVLNTTDKKIEGIKFFKKTGAQLVNANLRPKEPRSDSYVRAVLKKN